MWQSIIVIVIVAAVVVYLARKAGRVARGRDGLCCDACSGCAANSPPLGPASNQKADSCPGPERDTK